MSQKTEQPGGDRTAEGLVVGLGGDDSSLDTPSQNKFQLADVHVDEISVDDQMQMRVVALDPAVVDDYATDMEQGADFPAVILFCDGTTYWPADGFHRIA